MFHSFPSIPTRSFLCTSVIEVLKKQQTNKQTKNYEQFYSSILWPVLYMPQKYFVPFDFFGKSIKFH